MMSFFGMSVSKKTNDNIMKCTTFFLVLSVITIALLPTMFPLFMIASLSNEILTTPVKEYSGIDLSWQSEIPFIIHRLNSTSSSALYDESSSSSCRMKNPKFEMKIWTEFLLRNLINQNYSWFLHTYENYEYNSQRENAAKYFILRHFGGIFINSDIGCNRNLDDLMYTDYTGLLTPAKSNVGGVLNELMIFSRDHLFLRYLTHRLVYYDNVYITPSFTLEFSTGRAFLSICLHEYITSLKPKSKLKSKTINSLNPFEKQYNNVKIDIAVISPQDYYGGKYFLLPHVDEGNLKVFPMISFEWMIDYIIKYHIYITLGVVFSMLCCVFCCRICSRISSVLSWSRNGIAVFGYRVVHFAKARKRNKYEHGDDDDE